MINKPSAVNFTNATKYDKVHFGIIRIVHEGLYGLFVDPYRLLTEAGLNSGQRVLEVGCGPGFFTIPAAKIAGETGHVYAVDINPVAVQHVKRKVARAGLENVEATLADASETGLPSQFIDVAFLFGVMHAFKDVSKVLSEMHRVLRTKGALSIRSGVPAEKLAQTVSADRLFGLRERARGLSVFEKIDGCGP
jgi:ubiquinone/menaquinone biosynthesis C-methylase UbiE